MYLYVFVCLCLNAQEYTYFSKIIYLCEPDHLCVSRCVCLGEFYEAEGRGCRTSERVHGGREALGSATAAQASSSQIQGAIFRMSLIFPHRSWPLYSLVYNIQTKGKCLPSPLFNTFFTSCHISTKQQQQQQDPCSYKFNSVKQTSSLY